MRTTPTIRAANDNARMHASSAERRGLEHSTARRGGASRAPSRARRELACPCRAPLRRADRRPRRRVRRGVLRGRCRDGCLRRSDLEALPEVSPPRAERTHRAHCAASTRGHVISVRYAAAATGCGIRSGWRTAARPPDRRGRAGRAGGSGRGSRGGTARPRDRAAARAWRPRGRSAAPDVGAVLGGDALIDAPAHRRVAARIGVELRQPATRPNRGQRRRATPWRSPRDAWRHLTARCRSVRRREARRGRRARPKGLGRLSLGSKMAEEPFGN